MLLVVLRGNLGDKFPSLLNHLRVEGEVFGAETLLLGKSNRITKVLFEFGG